MTLHTVDVRHEAEESLESPIRLRAGTHPRRVTAMSVGC